ncbi:MAG TPA: GGDEF domain-containing protein [Thermoanaerobaculaceae bacterium]|nr:GGDEF domain-containing protein [Thermoanaerobaculaceae bacterium]
MGMMPAAVDLRPLGVAVTAVNVVLCAALLIFWRTQKTYIGFGYWVACQGVVLSAYLLLSLRGAIPDLFSVVLLNGLIAAAAALRSKATLLFFGRPRSHLPDLAAIPLAPAGAAWFLYANDAPEMRLLVTSAVTGFILARAAAALLPAARTQGAPPAVTAAFLLSFPAVMLLRVALWIVSPASRAVFASTAPNEAIFLFLLLYDVSITIFFLMLNARRLADDLIAAQGALERLALTDALTGLPNRRGFDERLGREWRRQARSRQPLSLLVVDIDLFKPYNDLYGHQAGDACLVRVAAAMREALREGVDVLARFGGEEFVALLPESGAEDAATVAERLRRAVEALDVAHNASSVAPVVTVSVGWASATPDADDLGAVALFAEADAALYRAKQGGRNRVATTEAVPAAAL